MRISTTAILIAVAGLLSATPVIAQLGQPPLVNSAFSEKYYDDEQDAASPSDTTMVRIEGHTDSRGPREMNVVLSQARAESVRRYLIQRGVSPSRLQAKGWGPDKPIVEEKTDEDLQKNRRVEFLIQKQ